MLALILSAILSADSRFTDGGHRAEDSVTGNSDGKTFAEIAKLATTPDNAPVLARYSLTGKVDYRRRYADRLWDTFNRYAGPVNVQFPSCHVHRTFDGLRQWDYRYSENGRPKNALTNDELRQFKAACYTLLRAQDFASRDQAIRHIIILADGSDLKPMLKLLKSRGAPAGLVCIALARIGDPSAIPAMAKELSGPDWERALVSLEFFGTPEALAAIEGAKIYDQPMARSMVAEIARGMRNRAAARIAGP